MKNGYLKIYLRSSNANIVSMIFDHNKKNEHVRKEYGIHEKYDLCSADDNIDGSFSIKIKVNIICTT